MQKPVIWFRQTKWMVFVETLVLHKLIGISYALKPNNFWCLWFSTQCFLSENVNIWKFWLSQFFNFVVVNFVISKNLKILKISDNNTPKIFKASTSEKWKLVWGFVKVLSRNMKKIFPRWSSFVLLIAGAFV